MNNDWLNGFQRYSCALRGQSTAKVVVVLRSAAVEDLTGLSARPPLIR